MFKRIVPYLKPVWFRFSIALICMAAVAGLSTGIVWLMKYLIDHAMTDKDLSALYTGVFLIIVSIGVKSVLWYTHTYLTAFVSHTASRQIRDDVYKHLYSLSMGFLMKKPRVDC
jgi:subfamily B ATP-binding cassette protein MsbA